MCGRCQGRMLYDTLFHQWRCIPCGNREDAVILSNRINPTEPDRQGGVGGRKGTIEKARMELE